VAIPEVVNLELDEAKFAIKNSGLVIGTITYEGTITDSTKVVVKSQYPMKVDTLSKVSIGTQINLTVTQKN
jgi:beta-lactam-binding protein with PASTA domain